MTACRPGLPGDGRSRVLVVCAVSYVVSGAADWRTVAEADGEVACKEVRCTLPGSTRARSVMAEFQLSRAPTTDWMMPTREAAWLCASLMAWARASTATTAP